MVLKRKLDRIKTYEHCQIRKCVFSEVSAFKKEESTTLAKKNC